MEIAEIRTIINDAKNSPDDVHLKGKYQEALSEYLKEKKSTSEIIPVVLEGMNIDRGANYYDFLETVHWNDLQKIFKEIRQSQAIEENKDNNSVKFLSGMLAQSFMKVGQMENQCGNIITLLVTILNSEIKAISAEVYGPIILDYAFDDLDANITYPKWERIKTSDEICKQFSTILIKVTENNANGRYGKIRSWAFQGIRYADEQIKKKRIEAKIPQSKADELQSIVEHYRTVEKLVRENAYQIDDLEVKISDLKRQIVLLTKEKHELEYNIDQLKGVIDEEKKQLVDAKEELTQQTKLNSAFGALKKNDQSALLKDMANDLKAVYQDFKDTESEKMDVQLGEIYREHIKSIFKILGKKGVRVE